MKPLRILALAAVLLGGFFVPAQAQTYPGVFTCAANQWMNSVAIGGVPVCTQPAFSNLSGSASAAQLPAGVDANVLNFQGSNYSVQTSDCGKRILPSALASFTITLPSTAGFSGTCRVSINNFGNTRGLKLSGFPSGTPSILYPAQEVDVAIENGAWALVANPVRWRLTSAVTFNVDPVNGSDTNDGLSTGSGNALATFQKCYDNIADSLDLVGQNATCLSVASASYTNAGVKTYKGVVGQGTDSNATTCSVLIDGNGSTITQNDGTWNFATGSNVTGEGAMPARFCTRRFTVTGSAGSGGFNSNGGIIQILDGMTFGATPGQCHMLTIGGGGQIILVNQSYTISGGGSCHSGGWSGGITVDQNNTVTCTGTPAFTRDFAEANFSGQLYIDLNSYSGCGGVTGTRFTANQVSIVGVNPETPTYLPGNAAGTVNCGSIYGGLNGDISGTAGTAGCMGEEKETSVALGSAISLTSIAAINLTSVSLTAGDWDVTCDANFNFSNASTSYTQLLASISTTSATVVTSPGVYASMASAPNVPGLNTNITVKVGPTRIGLAATTTVFCVLNQVFTVSTLNAWGIIRARRMR